MMNGLQVRRVAGMIGLMGVLWIPFTFAQDRSPLPARLLERQVRERPATNYVFAADVMDADGNPSYGTRIDVRKPGAYADAHIPGSLRFPLYQVKARSFLRSRNLILVDEGWGNPRLEEEVESLRARGFDSVHILDGGINAWRRAGGRMQGRAVSPARLAELDPAEFWTSRPYEDWMVIFPSADPSQRLETLLPEAVRIPFDAKDPGSFAVEMTRHRGAFPKLRRVLLVTEDGSGSSGPRRALEDEPGITVFTLKNGLAGLEQRLHMSAAMRNSTTKTTGEAGETKGDCVSCPE